MHVVTHMRASVRSCILKVLHMSVPHAPPCGVPNPHIVRRLRKRFNGFTAILRTHEYHTVYCLWLEGHINTMPYEPDPADLAVSKRAWESSIQTWRNELRRIVCQHAYANQ